MRFARILTRSAWIWLCVGAALSPEGILSQTLVTKIGNFPTLPQPTPKGIPLVEALAALEQAYHVHFLYEDAVVEGKTSEPLARLSNSFYDDLRHVIGDNALSYAKVGQRTIVITPKETAAPPPPAGGTIKGKVTDEKGVAIPFAEVILLGTSLGDATDQKGEYVITNVPPGSYTLETRFIGYRPQTAQVTVAEEAALIQDFSLNEDLLMMGEVVVTGTRTPRAKLQSTVAISTMSTSEIRQTAPRSSTELLRRIPGFTRVESSGGEVNQNISIRGILGVEYVNFMEDGMPVYPTMHTFFMNADNLFRPDENIERVEVVRGGNSALFGSNAPGATVNFINRTGGPEMGGVVKLTGGTGTLARYDFNVNGPLSDEWRFSLGGFYRYDQGIRDPGFPGIRGYQLKANTTRLLANGYVRLSAKILDDRNQFILPLPFQNPDDPKYVDGFSDTGAMTSLEGVGVTIPLPRENGELQIPLDDGIRTKGSWITADIGFNFANDWEIQNTARVMNTNHFWNAIVPGDVLNANEYAQSQLQALIDDGIVPAGSRAQLFFTNQLDNTGNKQVFDTQNGLINPGGEWHVEKPISDFSDQLLIKKRIENHNLNLGAYFAYYTQGNRWFFTDILTDIRDNPRFLDLVITNAAGTAVIHEVTQNGFRRFLSNYANGTGHATIFSVFGGDEFKVTDRLRLDIGGRYEHNAFRQVSENTSAIDLDGNPATAYDNEVWGNETFRQFDFSFDEWAASVGANYSLNDRVALYVQGSRGFKTPSLDEYIFPAVEQAALIEARHTLMLEGGVKTSSSVLGLTVTGFYGELSDQFGQGAITDTATGGIIWRQRQLPDNRSIGAEVEVSVAPASGLRLRGSGTILDSEFTDNIKNLAGAITDTIKGNWLPVVPPLLFDLSGIYSRSGFVLSADYHFVGKRYSNNTNTIELPKYGYLNFGLGYAFPGQGISLAANLLNALQSKGFEEGNPRIDESRGQASNLFLARPLLPRRFTLEVRYDF